MSAVRRSTNSVIVATSSGWVSRSPAARHCCTAASQPARLKMNSMAGSSPAPSSRATTSGRYGGRARLGRDAGGPPPLRPGRPPG